jgi:protein involved in polysaccharide export with SLBB domain
MQCEITRWAKLCSLAALLGLLALPGCANRYGMSADRNNMLPSTHVMRDASPVPPHVPRELDLQPQPPYVVEPGDVLLVTSTDLDSPVRLPGDQPVLPDGSITLGRYGRPVVAGRTLDEIEAIVRSLVLARTTGPVSISVRLASRQSTVYYVIGEVNSPGAFPLIGRETVLDGILAAGGLCDRASIGNIILSRPTRPGECRIVLPVCYREIVQLGDTTTNYQLQPGDRIFVPGKTAWEDLLHSQNENGPCGGCQVPCSLDHEAVGRPSQAVHLTPNGLGRPTPIPHFGPTEYSP